MIEVFCIRVTGCPLCENVRQALFQAAEKLLIKDSSRTTIKGDGFEGRVSTDRSTIRIASLFGTRFDAVIETGARKSDVTYIIRSPYDRALGGVRPTELENN
ncbi:MAG: hypothetical protein KGH68_00560 [Patescibacteria group bacterium]|nr:hypothetical protein [Patescibacteria group bacterium]